MIMYIVIYVFTTIITTFVSLATSPYYELNFDNFINLLPAVAIIGIPIMVVLAVIFKWIIKNETK